MRSLRKFLFRNETVSILLIVLAIMDGLLIMSIVSILSDLNVIQFRDGAPGSDSLFKWGFVSSWILSILIVSLIYGIGVINRNKFYKQIVVAIIFYTTIQFVLFGIENGSQSISSVSLLVIVAVTSFSILLFRTFIFGLYKFVNATTTKIRKFVIIGCNEKSEILQRSLMKDGAAECLGFFDRYLPNDDKFKANFKGYLEDVKAFCIEKNVREIYYTLPTDKYYIQDLSEFADQYFIFLGIVPDLEMQKRKKIDMRYLEDLDIPIITYHYSPLQHSINFSAKRAFDILFSLAALSVLVPFVFPVIALLIKLESKGPVFFKQKRPGRNNQIFDCYKFRSMVVNEATEKQASKNDKRITKVGAFIRKTSLDELPQFFNVLKGDMSIVGPRPNLISQLNFYSKLFPEYCIRHTVTPGITGYAQINGYRGETNEAYAMEKRLEYDLKYMAEWSLKMDILIIAKTVVKVFTGDEKAY